MKWMVILFQIVIYTETPRTDQILVFEYGSPEDSILEVVEAEEETDSRHTIQYEELVDHVNGYLNNQASKCLPEY